MQNERRHSFVLIDLLFSNVIPGTSKSTNVFTLDVLLNIFTQLFGTDFSCGLNERAISRIKHQKGRIYCMKSKLLFCYEGPWCQKADSKC